MNISLLPTGLNTISKDGGVRSIVFETFERSLFPARSVTQAFVSLYAKEKVDSTGRFESVIPIPK